MRLNAHSRALRGLVMRTTLIALIVVVLAAVGLCAFAQTHICAVVEEMDLLRVEAETRARAGDDAGAAERLTRLADRWQEERAAMEMLTSHDSLHEVYSELVDARVCLESGDYDDCYRALAQLGEALHHIREMGGRVALQPLLTAGQARFCAARETRASRAT